MRIVTVLVLALLITGCGENSREQRNNLRNEVITFRVAAEPHILQPAIVLASYQRLETAIAIARADGLKLHPETNLAIDDLLSAGEEAKLRQDAESAARLWVRSGALEAMLGDTQ